MPSIFTKIVNGEIPCYKIVENEKFLAFLDVFPISEGHTLVIPKQEIDCIFDLDEKTFSELMSFSRFVAIGLKKAIPCNRISIQVIGLEVPHAHVHLIPINTMNDCNFSKSKLNFSKEEFGKTAAKISEFLH